MMMVNSSYLSLAAVALSCLCACSEPEQVMTDGSAAQDTEISITLMHKQTSAFASSLYNPLNNRPPRMPVNWDGSQSVNDLRIYVFESDHSDGPFIYKGGGSMPDGAFQVSDFDLGVFSNNFAWNDEYYEAHHVALNLKLDNGHYYKFLAVGRDDRDLPANLPSGNIAFISWGMKVLGDVEVVPGLTLFEEAAVSCRLKPTQYPYTVTELFVGSLNSTHENDGSIFVDGDHVVSIRFLLRRQVASLWACFTKIPTTAIDNSDNAATRGQRFTPTELLIHLSNSSSKLMLVDGSGTEPTCERTLVGYANFSGSMQSEYQGAAWCDNGAGYWQRPTIQNYHGIAIPQDCAMMCGFMLPIDATKLQDCDATLTVELQHKTPDYTYVRSFNCVLASVADAITGETKANENDKLTYSIDGNTLYAIGSLEIPFDMSALDMTSVGSRNHVPEIQAVQLHN